MRILRIGAIAVALLAVVVLAGGTWLLGREAVPEQSDYRIDLSALRALARSEGGELPVRVNHERVAVANLPRAAVFAGESFEPHAMIHGAYQVRYPDGSFVLIDAAMSPEMYREQMAPRGGEFRAEGRENVDRAMEAARAIVLTHEHADHLDGLVRHPAAARVAARAHLNPEQLADPAIPDALRAALSPLAYEGAHPLAPGVVLLRAPGHTQGSQMVYVALADGSEWLFLGDVAWHGRQIEDLHYRPRLVTDWFIGEDREAVLAQFRALHDLARREPVQLVASHDLELHERLIREGRLGGRFE